MMTDSTSHKQTQEELRASEEKFKLVRDNERYFRSLIENSSDVITVLSADGTILFESAAVKRWRGYAPEELIGKQVRDFVHPEDLPGIEEGFDFKLSHPGVPLHFSCRMRHKNNSWRDVEGTSVNLLHDPAVKGIVANTRDVTERKQMDAQLRESNERFTAFMNNSPVVAFIKDEAGRFIYTNKTMERIFHLRASELIGKTNFDWMPEEVARRIRQHETPVLTANRTMEMIETVPTPDGLMREWLVFRFPITDASGKRFIGGVALDVTERRQAEEALRESEEKLRQSQKMEAVGQLAGGIAHDFNNLLTAINGYSELLLRRFEPNDPSRSKVEEIKKAGERAAQLTRQLLAFSRKQMLQPRVLNLNDVVADVSKLLGRLLGEHIAVSVRLEPEAAPVKADPGQIEQVILNLAVNARDAMPDGGKLIIEMQNVELDEHYAGHHVSVEHGRYVMLAVSDTGAGMDADTRSRIFEPFFTTKEQGKGTGLGLSTVYGIVKQSGGNIWVYSEVGLGTTFKIYLPRVDEKLESLAADAPALSLLSGTETVLLVEDEEIVRNMTREILEAGGYTVLEAAHGEEALTMAKNYEEEIHLLLTDVVMPRMGGRQLAERLLAMRPEMKVLYASGYTEESIVHHGVLGEGIAFLQKPFTPDALARKVRETLDAPGED